MDVPSGSSNSPKPDATSSSQAPDVQSKRRRAPYARGSGRDFASASSSKRSSVMALGSIRHLQHLYAKQGLAAEHAPQIGPSGRPLPLAVPGYSATLIEESLEDLPPSPSPPDPPLEKSFNVELPSLKVRRQQVYSEVADVCEKWGLVSMSRHASGRGSTASSYGPYDSSLLDAHPASEKGDDDNLILGLLQSTTAAIRSVQKYFLSLPPDRLPFAPVERSDRVQPESTALGLITAARPIPKHSSLSSGSKLKARAPSKESPVVPFPSQSDPLVELRKASLATLGMLKQMDKQYRLHDGDNDDEERDLVESMSSANISSGSSGQPALTFSEEPSSASDASSSTGATGVSGGHLYDSDVTLRELRSEAQVVQQWIETVDKLLFPRKDEQATPRDAGMQFGPDWSREDLFTDRPLERLYACLSEHLPPELLTLMPSDLSESGKDSFLQSLSDGHSLCIAYNAVLRKSQRPWGFITSSSIHDVRHHAQQRAEESSANTSRLLDVQSAGRRRSDVGLSEDGQDALAKVGLTFRRYENLRLFVAALKLRYLLSSGVEIDPKVIARKEEGWQDMLQALACSWVSAAAEEKRNEEPDSD